MNTTNGSSLSTSKSSSTLRPRTRRLISVEDDVYATDGSGSEGFSSRAGSRIASRTASPANVTSSPSPSAFFRSAGMQASKATRDTSSTLSGLFGTWGSAVQGLAANVLGTEPAPNSNSAAAARRRNPHTRRTSTSAPPPKQWGPAGAGSHVGAGTQEEREAMVRDMKRRDLLNATEHLHPDSIGRMKRRNSDDRTSASAPPAENDHGDALVYVHHAKKQDTLAGVCIKYSCEQAVLRKANRMWPNDTILSKKTIVLPVDACGVKGRPVQGPDALPEEDLLLGEYGSACASSKKPDEEGLPNGWATPKQQSTDNSSVVSSNAATDHPWTHDSWVLLPNDKQPTQIARMPRRALGFFPPARRKSVAYSDATSTPRASVDLPRSSTSTTPNTLTSSPSQPTRPRASSNLSSLSAHSRQRSTSGQQPPLPKPWLSGPGGVGTLGRNVRSPGPAQDGLNKMFAAHLPSMAPPPGQEYFTPWAPSLLDADGTRGPGSGVVTPSGGDINFQEIGGAIEGWVRKVGSHAQKLLAEPGTPGGRQKVVPGVGATGGGLGDLIELQDEVFEVGDGEEERGRAREGLSVPGMPSAERSSSRHSAAVESSARAQWLLSSSRQDFSLVLRERGGGGGGGKTD